MLCVLKRNKRSKAMQKVHLRFGAVSASARAIASIKSKLIKLERGYFPMRGNGVAVEDALREFARNSPKDFTEGSRLTLGV
jgi:hypothetical protein